MEFNWGVFWALLAAFAIVVTSLALYALWRSRSAARRASREEMIDAAVNAFTAGAFTKEEMEAMIREANKKGRTPSA